MALQLQIFEPLVLERAAQLLALVNDGRKSKYYMQWFFEEKGVYVFMAANKDKKIIFNALDYEGNIPKDFSADWRTWPHVKQELKNYKKLCVQ